MPDNTKFSLCRTARISCHNCQRLTKIGGETLCYQEGEIFRLTESLLTDKPSLICTRWQASPSIHR